MEPQKTALLHYWLVNRRGGENVLAEFCRLWPEADIFTHAWNPEAIGEPFSSHRIVESFIGRLPGARRNCQKYLPLMPAAIRRLDLSGYKLIVSSESGPIKGVRKPKEARACGRSGSDWAKTPPAAAFRAGNWRTPRRSPGCR